MKPSMKMMQTTRLELHLSPLMVQTMRLLTLPILDFNQTVETMADDNPVLEVIKPTETPSGEAVRETETEGSSGEEWDERVLQQIAELADDPSQGGGSWAGSSSRPDEDWTDPTLRLTATPTLHDDLLEQVRLNLSGKKAEKIGEFIVQDLDSRGFLTRPVCELAPDIAAFIGEPVTDEDVTEVIEHLRATLEPPGICASTVEESIALQLRRQGKEELTELLVKGYQLVSSGRERELARLCAKHKVETAFVFDQLATLHFVPTVGVAEEPFDSNSVRPEVTIVPENPDISGPEKYEVRYNSAAIVRLSLNPKIIELARRRDTLGTAERQFLRKKVQEAKWLKQIVEDRRSLLLRTVRAIVDRQWEFLDKGPRFLRPLTQREIADVVGRDESTISRLIKGRFADSPQGCIRLGAFFSQAVGKSSGAAAREALRDIMDSERAGVAYTDDELAEQMRLRGFAIQRRTVNKYRRMLGGYYALRRSLRRVMKQREESIEASA